MARLITSDFLSDGAVSVVSSVLLNLVAFGIAAEVLLALTLRVLERSDLAWLAVCWFSLTPAGIFMSAAYTERWAQCWNINFGGRTYWVFLQPLRLV